MSIENILEGFFSSKEPGAIVLQGRWGVGKTYFWRHKMVPALPTKPRSNRYSYVSLFGINSLQELKMALAVATEEFDQERRDEQRRAHKLLGWFWRGRAWLSDILQLVPNFGAGLAKLHDKLSFYLLRDRIICFDDIERHSLGLNIKDFLGLVTYLVDQRNCQVVVILNSGQLGEDQSVWDDHREKVFDGELTYEPSQEETIALGLMNHRDESWYQPMREGWIQLGVVNIRLVRRAATYMSRALEAAAKGLRTETVEHMARALVLLTYSLHGKGEGAPPIEMIMQHGGYMSALLDEKDRSEQEKRWNRTIEDFGLYLHTPLDHQLRTMVQHGYPDQEELSEAITLFEANSKAHADHNAWLASWRSYHGTVLENGDEIVQAFQQTWPVVSRHESAGNLEALARILRLLGRPDLATDYIDTWVSQRTGSRIKELEPREIHKFGKINDHELIAAIEQVREHSGPRLDLQEAYDLVRGNQSYDSPALKSFAAASPQEIVQLFEANSGEDLTNTIKWLLGLPKNPHEPHWERATQNVRRACLDIAARSALGADRMRNWFGIKPEELEGASIDSEMDDEAGDTA